MATNRTLNAPGDIANYPENQLVFRNFRKPPQYPAGRVIECSWGAVYEEDGETVKHPAEEVSFAEVDGGWDKSLELRLG